MQQCTRTRGRNASDANGPRKCDLVTLRRTRAVSVRVKSIMVSRSYASVKSSPSSSPSPPSGDALGKQAADAQV
jgi:hypothetical protein